MSLETIPDLLQQVEASMDRAPDRARALARAAFAQSATGSAREHAQAALALSIVLNRLGDFAEAAHLADQAAASFEREGEREQAARALTEAAWAMVFTGDLSGAATRVERAKELAGSPHAKTRCDWAAARVLQYWERYVEAEPLLECVRAWFEAAGQPLDAARCERDVAYGHLLGGTVDVRPRLERVRKLFESAGCALDAAQCDHLYATYLGSAGRHGEAAPLLLGTRHEFERLGAGFFAAWCDTSLGIAYRHLGRFEDSLQAASRARDHFLEHGIRRLLPTCDVTLGNTYYALNRYDEALAHYRQAAEGALAEGREELAARLWINMGLVYARQGQYSQALDSYHRALATAQARDLTPLANGAYMGLAWCLRDLGQYPVALEHLQAAAKWMSTHAREDGLIQCRMDVAEIQMAQGDFASALHELEQARPAAEARGTDLRVAACDRLLAGAALRAEGPAAALEHIRRARTVYAQHGLVVDTALCDLVEGQAHLESKRLADARACFRRAEPVLSPGFPDQAWRVDAGLGQCAAAAGRSSLALRHYQRAVHTIAQARSAVVDEALSNDFYGQRQSIYDRALALALEQGSATAALEIIEAGKARTLVTLLQRRGWRAPSGRDDPYLADLVQKERRLRRELEDLRERLAGKPPHQLESVLRGETKLTAATAAAMQELNALNQAYEALVAQLRLAATELGGVPVPASFDLEKFREGASSTWGAEWTAVDYHLSGNRLTVVLVSPKGLETHRRELTEFDLAIFDKCTRPDPNTRELVYRGTLRGEGVPSACFQYLRHLYGLLLPFPLAPGALIVAPTGALHTLPFHALLEGDVFLAERHAVVYTPSLQALQHLLAQPRRAGRDAALVLGVSQFGEQSAPLPHAPAEVDQLREILGEHGAFLQGESASRQRLLDLNSTGELARFDLIHLAAHAVLDRGTPHRSRVLLHDEPLTTLDVLDLSLETRLVTLSACQTALGRGGAGDEWVGLARAFFYAGAQALLATLWPVEDRAMVELTGRFYRHWVDGADAAVSLQQAQVEMIRAGCSPYQWAPAVLIGRP